MCAPRRGRRHLQPQGWGGAYGGNVIHRATGTPNTDSGVPAMVTSPLMKNPLKCAPRQVSPGTTCLSSFSLWPCLFSLCLSLFGLLSQASPGTGSGAELFSSTPAKPARGQGLRGLSPTLELEPEPTGHSGEGEATSSTCSSSEALALTLYPNFGTGVFTKQAMKWGKRRVKTIAVYQALTRCQARCLALNLHYCL